MKSSTKIGIGLLAAKGVAEGAYWLATGDNIRDLMPDFALYAVSDVNTANPTYRTLISPDGLKLAYEVLSSTVPVVMTVFGGLDSLVNPVKEEVQNRQERDVRGRAAPVGMGLED